MKRPTVFVSSTIYDFSDLRSALKYWLTEMGFDAQLSEYNDFYKNLNTNSYEACLQSVSECDYFILLIGARRGGMYPGEDISITRKEYRVAYDLAKAGKIKKLIVFIRQNIWDVKEDRKALHQLLKGITALQNDKPIDTTAIENHSSSIIRDAEHIFDFINEVTRKEDARNGNMPNMNWIHTFSSFADIISTLKVELKANFNISIQVAEQNLKMALVYTLQKIAYKTDSGVVTAFYIPFGDIRSKLKKFRDTTKPFNGKGNILLSKQEVHRISDFITFYYWGIDELSTFEFENALSSGVFMDFNVEKGIPVYNNFCRMLHQLIEEVNRVKRLSHEFPLETHQKMLDNIQCYHECPYDTFEFEFFDLALLSSIYERLINIQTISFYLVDCIARNDRWAELPEILNGLVDMGKPSESDILRIFDGKP